MTLNQIAGKTVKTCITHVNFLQTRGYSFSVLVIGAGFIGAIPVHRDELDPPSCAVNISLSCDFTACHGSQTQCHKKYMAEKKVVLQQITRLRQKIKAIMKKQVVICVARIEAFFFLSHSTPVRFIC